VLHGIDNYIVSYTNSIRNMEEYIMEEIIELLKQVLDITRTQNSHELSLTTNLIEDIEIVVKNSEKSTKYYWVFDEAYHQMKVVSTKETRHPIHVQDRTFYNSVKEAENDMPQFRHLYV